MIIKISIEDNGREINLTTGDVLCIELPENPTTGFRWSIQMPLPASLEPVRDSFTPADSALGAGGHRDFELMAKSQGDFRLTLYLRREWEEAGREMDTFTLDGRVAPVSDRRTPSA